MEVFPFPLLCFLDAGIWARRTRTLETLLADLQQHSDSKDTVSAMPSVLTQLTL